MGGWIWMRARPSPTASSGCSPLFPDPSCPHGRMDLDARPAVTYCILWMLTFVSRSLLPSWEDGFGCAPGRHLLHPLDAHLCFQIPLALMGGWIWMRARPSPTASSGCSPLFPDP